MGWAQPQKGICASYELAVGPGCRGSLDEFENKTLYVLKELNATQNTQRILSYHLELQVQSDLDYPDPLGPNEIVQIIEGQDNRKYEY